MVINSVLCMLYYNVIISWALFYFVSSLRKDLLWKKCGYWRNDKKCFVAGAGSSPFVVNETIYNCTASEYANRTMYECVPINSSDIATATEQFY